MPLAVPVLRFFVVFLNVYETFKTLKPPPPSARRGGQPSVRAVSQRKRDLKGCLAIWVIWCCYAAYERTFDQVVGIFLPFYSEIKSVFLLFLVLTRAKGAEPLFLHVLRPLVKPYTAIVDPTLELSSDIGDFLFALSQVPLDYLHSLPWFRFQFADSQERHDPSSGPGMSSANSESSTHNTSKCSSIPVLAENGSDARTSRVQNKHHRSIHSVSGNEDSYNGPTLNNPASSDFSRDQRARFGSATSLPIYSEHPSHGTPRYSQTLSGHNSHQIWYPPCQEVSTPRELLGIAPEYHSPEWRAYPAFPSAYPSTPLPAATSLPTSVVLRSDNVRLHFSGSTYPRIPEDEQGLGETLERQHEGLPGLVRGSSNNNKLLPGADGYEDALVDDSMCGSEAGLSEDDFGTSLRTPHRSPDAIPSSACSSVDSLTSPPTTSNNAFPLWIKTSSEFSSGSSSLAGQKRARGTFQQRGRSTLQIPHSRNATLRGRPAPLPVPQDPLQSSSSEDDGGDTDDSSTMVKRQRVLDPVKRKCTVRPVAREMNNGPKGPSPSRSVSARGSAVTTIPQASSRTRGGSIATNNSTMKGRKPTLTSRQVRRGGPHGVIKTSSTSSSQSGTRKGRMY